MVLTGRQETRQEDKGAAAAAAAAARNNRQAAACLLPVRLFTSQATIYYSVREILALLLPTYPWLHIAGANYYLSIYL